LGWSGPPQIGGQGSRHLPSTLAAKHPASRAGDFCFMAKYEDYNEGRAVTGYTRTKVSVTLDLFGQKS